MNWLDLLERRAREATRIAVHAPRVQAPARPLVKADIKTVPVQTAAPSAAILALSRLAAIQCRARLW
jgi:hypothetical protein